MDKTDAEIWKMAKDIKDDYPIIADLMDIIMTTPEDSGRDVYRESLRQAVEDIYEER